MLLSDVLLSDKAERDLINVPLPDPTWETVTQLFPSRIGMKILLAILASARIVQRTLPECGQADVAVLSRKNLAGFAKQLGCGKDTFLRYIKMYQSIGLLTHSRTWSERNSVTELHLPLIPYQPSAVALQRVEALMRGGRKKQQDLARYVRDRYILLYGLPARDNQETEARSDLLVGLLSKVSRLLQKNRLGRIERQALCCEIADALRHRQGDLHTGEIPQRGDPFSALQGHAIQTKEENPRGCGSNPLVSQQGDLSENKGREVQTKEGDLSPQRGDQRNQYATLPGDLASEGGDLPPQGGGQFTLWEHHQGDFCAQESKKMQQPGDLEAREALPSSIEFLSLDSNSLRKELELESQTGDPWTGSEEDLFQEAVRYLRIFDGPEYATPDYLSTHAGKKAVGGYKNKIRRSPRLARIAAINTLLQRTFYDLTRQKKPLENAGKWFHSSFDRYVDPDRPMEITGEILDWVKSHYTLQEIALVLPRERKRQETQWWSSEAPHLPFSSCVVTHQHLRDDASALQMSIFEQPQDLFLTETARQCAGCQGMSCTEAEQVADEIRKEASWYLYEIHTHLAPQLGENAYVVEATMVEIAFPVVYASRQEWWQHHQEQLRHQDWEEHQKREIGSAHAIF